MSERITQGLRDAMATGARLTEFDGHILDETIWANRAEFENLCDAIDAIHANLERENDRLKCELDRVLGELDEMHKTDGISDNSSGFMHNAERSIGSAVITITPTLDWSGVARELRSIADTLDAGSCKRVMDSIDPFAMWVCDHCGHPLDTSESFCGGCGRKVVTNG